MIYRCQELQRVLEHLNCLDITSEYDQKFKLYESCPGLFSDLLESGARHAKHFVAEVNEYLESQYSVLIPKALSDLQKVQGCERFNFVLRIIAPILGIGQALVKRRSICLGDEVDITSATWWGPIFTTIFEAIDSLPGVSETHVAKLASVLEDSDLLGPLLCTFTNLVTVREMLARLFVNLDVDLLSCAVTREYIEAAISSLMQQRSTKLIILKHLTPRLLLLFKTPHEGLVELIKESESTDLQMRVELNLRLFECMANPALANHLGGSISMEVLVSKFYKEILTVEVFTSSYKFFEVSETLVSISYYFTKPLITFYYFKRSLSLACILPPHRALWLVRFAHLLLLRNPLIILPSLHVNSPETVDVFSKASLDYYSSMALPSELPNISETGVVHSDEVDVTHRRVAQLPCFELLLLRRHSSAAVREASLAITHFLSNEQVDYHSARQSVEEALNVGWHKIVDGGVKRARSRLEVSTELFSH